MRAFNDFAFVGTLAVYLSTVPVNAYLCLGCWTGGNPLPKILPGPGPQPLSNVTVRACAAHCAGWWLFALEGGKSCYCGKTINLDINQGGAAPAASNSCSVACSGDNNQTCGGEAGKSFDLYVYLPGINSADAAVSHAITSGAATDVAVTPPALASRSLETYTSLGCWRVGYVLASIFIGKNWMGMPDMTVQRCAAWCSGYLQFAVGGADQCFCGTALITADEDRDGATPDSGARCFSDCSGDPTQNCGGWGGNFHFFAFSNSSMASPASTTEVLSLETPIEATWQSTPTIGINPSTFVTEQRVPSSSASSRLLQ